MFPFGSGMRPQKNPPPSASVANSCPDYPNSRGGSIQMPVPFGAGIGLTQNYLPQNPVYSPQNSGYPPQNPGYPPQNPGYPPQNLGYPPQNPGYPSQNPGYPPQNPGYPPQNPGYPPQNPGYPPQNPGCPSQNPGYPPQNPGYPPQNLGYPPQNPPQNEPNPPQNTLNMYPNLNKSAPFSYTQSPPVLNRSTSRFMRQGTPTVLPAEHFDPQNDAGALRKAMKGFGCDDKALIEIICKRNNQQRQDIQKVFKTNFGKDLIENIESETSGNFERLLTALLTPILDYYCKEIKDAMAGIGTDEDVLIEILCTLSNFEIVTIKEHYKKKFGADLENDIIGDTSGNFKRLLVALCTANRDESGETDPDQAKADATSLLRAGELMMGTDESTFNSVLCQRNYEQLKLIFREYETMTGHSFEVAIKNEFSGDIKKGFLAIFRCVNNKAEFFAHQLMKSMKGLGTNDRQLIRLIVTRCEIDMTEIKEAFARLFGESLKECIRGDTSGSYKKALYTLIGEQSSS